MYYSFLCTAPNIFTSDKYLTSYVRITAEMCLEMSVGLLSNVSFAHVRF
jgi:hypothetical protein